MDAEQLPDDNDVVIFGTGMTESIISAALSRVEMSVLCIDKNGHYGGDWGSFNFSGFRELIASEQDSKDLEKRVVPDNLGPNENFIPFNCRNKFLKNVHEYSHPLQFNDTPLCGTDNVSLGKKTEAETENSPDATHDKGGETEDPKDNGYMDDLCKEVVKRQRHFTIDLLPKMMYCRGMLIELLISSDVARYCEFKLASRILTYINNSFEKVPSSRSEVFSTTSISVIDKRMLMKFLNFAMEFEKNEDEYKGQESNSFVEFLKVKKLSPILQHYVRHAIAMVNEDATVVEGLKACQKYLMSLGRYGNSSFLTPLYGTGELLQCFCRMSSVFGGVYCLRRNMSGIITEGNRVVAVIDSFGQRIKTKWLVMEAGSSSQFETDGCSRRSDISRAILVTDKSIYPDKEQHTTLANIPSPQNPNRHILMQEFSPSSRTCPEKFHMVHLTCQGSNAESDLSHFVEEQFNLPDHEAREKRPNVIWVVYFNLEGTTSLPFMTKFENLILVPGPDHLLDCDSSVTLAEEIFNRMCPDKEFLPRAPGPEEIVFFDSDPVCDLSLNDNDAVGDEQTTDVVASEDSEAPIST